MLELTRRLSSFRVAYADPFQKLTQVYAGAYAKLVIIFESLRRPLPKAYATLRWSLRVYAMLGACLRKGLRKAYATLRWSLKRGSLREAYAEAYAKLTRLYAGAYAQLIIVFDTLRQTPLKAYATLRWSLRGYFVLGAALRGSLRVPYATLRRS